MIDGQILEQCHAGQGKRLVDLVREEPLQVDSEPVLLLLKAVLFHQKPKVVVGRHLVLAENGVLGLDDLLQQHLLELGNDGPLEALVLGADTRQVKVGGELIFHIRQLRVVLAKERSQLGMNFLQHQSDFLGREALGVDAHYLPLELVHEAFESAIG